MAEFSRRVVRACRLPTGEVSPAFFRRMWAAIRAAEAERAAQGVFWKPLEILARRLSWSAAVALALLAVCLFTFNPPREVPQVSRQTEIREIFPEPPQPANRDEVLLALAENVHGR